MKTLHPLKMRSVAVVLAVALGMSAGWSAAEDAAASRGLSSEDDAFIRQAGESQLAGQELGSIGKKKAASPVVKSLAATLAKDYIQGTVELWKIAASKDAAFPPSPGFIQKIKIDFLHTRSNGPSFDKAFVHDVLEEQENDLAYYEKASRGLRDLDLKAFATRTIPVLKKHIKMARNAAASVK